MSNNSESIGGGSSGTMAENPRTSFNAAYSTLEQAIRNFSKEKLMYEQTIEGLKKQVVVVKESFQQLNHEHQEVKTENKRLLYLHEENEKTRLGVDALIASAERKQEIIWESLEGFEKVESTILSRFEAHEDFIYSLKFRQTQLLNWIDKTRKNNSDLQLIVDDLHRERDTLTKSLADSKVLLEENCRAFENEKSCLIASHQTALADKEQQFEQEKKSVKVQLESELRRLTEEFKLEKDRLAKEHNEMTARLKEDFKQEQDRMNEEFNQTHQNMQLELKEMQERLSIECEHVKAERDSLQLAVNDLHQERDTLTKSLTDSNALLEEKNCAFESLTKSFADSKALVEENCRAFESEKDSLIANHKQAMEDKEQELENSRTELRDLQKRYQDQKYAIGKLVEEVGVRPIVLPKDKSKFKTPSTPTTVHDTSFTSKSPRSSTSIRPSRNPLSTPNRSESIQQKGILKRSTENADKSKNVSFGPTTVNDFVISSGSDSDTALGDMSNSSKQGASSAKRMKLNESFKEDDIVEPNESGKEETKSSSKRHFFRSNRIGPSKSSHSSIA